MTKWQRPFCSHSTKDDLFVKLAVQRKELGPFQDDSVLAWLVYELVTWKIRQIVIAILPVGAADMYDVEHGSQPNQLSILGNWWSHGGRGDAITVVCIYISMSCLLSGAGHTSQLCQGPRESRNGAAWICYGSRKRFQNLSSSVIFHIANNELYVALCVFLICFT